MNASLRIYARKLRDTFIPSGRKILKVKVNCHENFQIFPSPEKYKFIVNLEDNTEFRQQVNKLKIFDESSDRPNIQVKVTQCLNPEKSCGGGDLVLDDYDTFCHQVGLSSNTNNK